MRLPNAERTLQSVLLHHPQIPPPQAGFPFAHSGRKWRFAFAWPDRKIACEYEAPGDPRSAEKCSAAAVAGWLVIRVTAELVRNGRALVLIEQAHRARA